ncbi:MAG: hypothetical protein M1834_002472 [Cirrosporium novae-zelandiae]|nr:MAG: hypothetical protein M1834_002472 [Cirrosporium novae-zelandiae]
MTTQQAPAEDSVTSSVYNFRKENGRTYHAYKEGDLQHELYLRTLGQKLYLAPLKSLHEVLDVGTGSGIWAIDFADEHPSARVCGTDLSPNQPAYIPPNCEFLIDDANEAWTFNREFDYVHCRQLHTAIEEKKLFQQAFSNLKPGGWIEMQELAQPVCCDDGTIPDDCLLKQWCMNMLKAAEKGGHHLDNPPKYKMWIEEAGFINVHEERLKWPMNPWPEDEEMKTLGQWAVTNAMSGLNGFTMAQFTRHLGWSSGEVEVFLAGVRKDLMNQSIHGYWAVYVVYGQKPGDAEGDEWA